jgi:peptidoglycan/LPS O-acetylase OafA/YrhL
MHRTAVPAVPSGPSRPEAAPAASGRLIALDGARGAAAFVVAVSHCLFAWDAVYSQLSQVNRGSRTWLITWTPLHIFWAGHEAVFLFFVLSGMVLVVPYLGRRRPGPWAAYYVRRLTRLYVPVAAAVVLAAAIVHFFPRAPKPGLSEWYTRHDVPVTVTGMLRDAFMLKGSGMVNSVLWSLQYEVVFSLVLPVVVILARHTPPRLVITLPGALALVWLAQTSPDVVIQWGSVFLVGAALAVGRDDLRRLGERVRSLAHPAVTWLALTVLAVILTLAEWWFRAFGVDISIWRIEAKPPIVAGCVLICFLALECPLAGRLFSSRLLQWAGRISFSLYLVHEPIVVSFAGLAGGGRVGTPVTLVVGLGVSVVVAVLFHRFVEAPAQRLSRRLGRQVGARLHLRESRAVPRPRATTAETLAA